MTRDRTPDDPVAAVRRARARRTAWVVGGIALVIYVAFIMTGVVGR